MKAEIQKIFDELQNEAYDHGSHMYYYKQTNQIIRLNVEKIIEDFESQLEKAVKCDLCDQIATHRVIMTNSVLCDNCFENQKDEKDI